MLAACCVRTVAPGRYGAPYRRESGRHMEDTVPETTIKCPICGRPYVVYSHYAGDQSACPACRAEARKGEGLGQIMKKHTTYGIEKGVPTANIDLGAIIDDVLAQPRQVGRVKEE